MPSRAVCRAAASAVSRWAAEAPGAISCEVGTGTMEMFGVAEGEIDAAADGVRAEVGVGAVVGVGLPHATTAAISRIAAAARRVWRLGPAEGLGGITTRMVHPRGRCS